MRTRIIRLLAVGMSLFQIITSFFLLESFLQRSIHLLFALVLVFLIHLPKKPRNILITRITSITLLGFSIITLGYLLINNNYYFGSRFPYISPYTTIEIILAIAFLIVILEATRRVTGWILPIMSMIALAYILFGQYMPEFFGHISFRMNEVFDVVYLSLDGTFGLPLGISATYLFLFVLFGSFLVESGVGSLVMEFAIAAAGHYKGGPAKIAVIGSALTGMVSGSPVANVLTTGAFTIPLMKSIGYKPEFAGGVEAAASTGGMITPPVMGVLAFLMAEYAGIPYVKIIGYAILPALLFYFSVMMMVHLEAGKNNMRGMDKQEGMKAIEVLRKRGHLLIPIIILTVLLIMQYSPRFSVTLSLLSIPICTYLRKETRMNIQKILKALEDGAISSLLVIMGCAVAGLLGGLIGMSGIGLKLSSSLLDISGGSIFLSLFLVMITTIVLGTGLPSIVAYTIQIPITIPALINMGLQPVVAHFFVVYFATMAFITPPVGMAFYASAGLAEANLMKTGLQAMKIGIAGFLVPFIFVYQPQLLGIGTPIEIAWVFLTSLIAIYAIAIGLQGYSTKKIGIIGRLTAILSGLIIIIPGYMIGTIGIVLLLTVLFGEALQKKAILSMQNR